MAAGLLLWDNKNAKLQRGVTPAIRWLIAARIVRTNCLAMHSGGEPVLCSYGYFLRSGDERDCRGAFARRVLRGCYSRRFDFLRYARYRQYRASRFHYSRILYRLDYQYLLRDRPDRRQHSDVAGILFARHIHLSGLLSVV